MNGAEEFASWHVLLMLSSGKNVPQQVQRHYVSGNEGFEPAHILQAHSSGFLGRIPAPIYP
jgi:hypothetical protein